MYSLHSQGIWAPTHTFLLEALRCFFLKKANEGINSKILKYFKQKMKVTKMNHSHNYVCFSLFL